MSSTYGSCTDDAGSQKNGGKPLSMGQQILNKGCEMLQSFKPINQMSQHASTFGLYSHDMSRQIETHHFITRLSNDFLQAAVYDTDHPNARLIGKITLISYFNCYSYYCYFFKLRVCLSINYKFLA